MQLNLTLINPHEDLNQKMEFPYSEETKLRELKEEIHKRTKIEVERQKMFTEDGRLLVLPDLDAALTATELKDLGNVIVKHGKMDTWNTVIRATDDLKTSCTGNFNAEELQNILYPLCVAFLEDLDNSNFFVAFPNCKDERLQLQRIMAHCFAKICRAIDEKAAKAMMK